MTVEELPVQAYVQCEDWDWEDIKDFPGADEDYLVEFEAEVIRLVESYFRQACARLWPLIREKHFRSVSIGVDMIGLERGLAGYYHIASREGPGDYGFSVSDKVIKEYLKARYDQNYLPDSRIRHTWEHEVIHMTDHRFLTEYKFNIQSTDVREFLIHFLLSFRNEGIAELWSCLKGLPSLKDPSEARRLFHEEMARFSAVNWEDPEIIRDKEWEVMHTFSFYSAGPWMILHVLGCHEFSQMTTLATAAAQKMAEGWEMTDEEIIGIVRNAVKISNEDFIRHITSPGADGLPFFDKQILDMIASRVDQIRHPWVISEEDDEYVQVNAMIIGLFNRLWNEKKENQ